MKIDGTKEAIASEALYDYFSYCPESMVHAWRPPDGRACSARPLYIPRDGSRYHVDLIVQIGETLYLIGVKDCLANSYDDAARLRQITAELSTGELVECFRQQGEPFPVVPWETCIAVAAKESDEDFLRDNPELPVLLADRRLVSAANDLGDYLLARSVGAV